MVEISKKELIFSRGEGGVLLAQDVELENIEGKPTIKIIPLTRGNLQEIYQKATSGDPAIKIQADNDVIRSGLVSPELTNEEIGDMKPTMALNVTQAILAISLGVSQKSIGDKTQEVIQNQELLLKKK